MATIGRGRGRGGIPGSGGPGQGGGPNPRDNGAPRRGVWRGGPPGSGVPGSGFPPRNSPVVNNVATGPRTSINDHMNDLRKVEDQSKTSAKSFQTDTDISNAALKPRELQPWVPDAVEPSSTPSNGNGKPNGMGKDAETFGSGGNGGNTGSWDQFATNERLFGATTSYQEEIYTTKLNRSGPDFRKREKEAEKLANEIMGAASSNPHMLEERNQLVEDWAKDEEERFSGVTRAPNAYVPPGARRSGAGPPTAPTITPARPPASTAATATGVLPKTNGAATPAALAAIPPTIERSTSEIPPSDVKASASTAATVAAAPTAESKEKIGGVVDKFREFVGSEREKVEAKKQAVVKSERDRHMAELKKFHSDFKIPLPIPKDILPILSKDSEKQKAIEAKVADGVVAARQQAEQRKVALSKSPLQNNTSNLPPTTSTKPSTTTPGKKMAMKISEIPPFGGAKPKAPVLPIPETASKDIQLSTSPTPSSGSQATGAVPKLNPGASTFVFKPNPGAAVFKPTEPTVTSPPPVAAKLPAAPAQPVASSSTQPLNPFFGTALPKPHVRGAINIRDDFSPWKNGSVPQPSAVLPQWPYTGRKSALGYPGMHAPPPVVPVFDEEAAHGIPMMQAMPPNFPPYGYRFNPQMPMPGQMGNPMFSPGPQFAPLPSGPMQQHQHIPQGQHPNGMPMYFNNGGMPHNNPNFIPPQMHYNMQNPNGRPPLPQGPGSQIQQNQGPGPGGPGGPGPQGIPQQGPGGPGQGQQQQQQQGQGQGQGQSGQQGGMYFHQGQIPTPQQTPQLQHNLAFPNQPYQNMMSPGPGP